MNCDLLTRLHELAVIGRIAFLSGKQKEQGAALCAFAEIIELCVEAGVEPINSYNFQEQESLERHQELVKSAFPAETTWPTIDSVPPNTMVLLANADWISAEPPVKVGYWFEEEQRFQVFGASWIPTHWAPLPGLHKSVNNFETDELTRLARELQFYKNENTKQVTRLVELYKESVRLDKLANIHNPSIVITDHMLDGKPLKNYFIYAGDNAIAVGRTLREALDAI